MATTNNNTNVNNNENKQPMQYHKFSYSGGYIMNPVTGYLEEAHPHMASYDFEAEKESFSVRLASNIIIPVDVDTQFYNNEAEYRDGKSSVSLFKKETETRESIIADLPQFNCYRHTIIVKRDGQPVEIDGYDVVKDVIFDYDERGHLTSCHTTADLPAVGEYYNDLEEYYHWNTLTVLDDDGTMTTKGGEYDMLTPTHDQQALIDDVFRAMNAAREAGVRFFYDSDDDLFFAANFADKHIDTRWDGDFDKDDADTAFRIHKAMRRLPNNNAVWMCGYELEAVRFKEEQK